MGLKHVMTCSLALAFPCRSPGLYNLRCKCWTNFFHFCSFSRHNASQKMSWYPNYKPNYCKYSSNFEGQTLFDNTAPWNIVHLSSNRLFSSWKENEWYGFLDLHGRRHPVLLPYLQKGFPGRYCKLAKCLSLSKHVCGNQKLWFFSILLNDFIYNG